ncbi:hypothetical protein EDF80_101232 [Pseudomonas brenneri]|nr:hypothetical protein EDF80_101232 [Pseudomonas brenneri]
MSEPLFPRLMGLLWRAGLPRAGLRSSPKTGNGILSEKPRRAFWGCCAAQRGASPLATATATAIAPSTSLHRKQACHA